jgi:aryl-alcohol dehydrogenase-like predicted oxidoreductase
MATLDTLVAAGKLRYAGVSNYPGWQLMKALRRPPTGIGCAALSSRIRSIIR